MNAAAEASDGGIGLHGSLWMTAGGRSLGARGRVALLAALAEHGSITQAAKALGMSYRVAWAAIDTMNEVAGEPRVSCSVGGKGGGGSCLTPRGRQLVDHFRLIEQEHRRFIERLDRQARGLADDCLLIGRMGMRTSARNQFQGRVTGITPGAVNDEIELEVLGGLKIVAVITRESTEALALEIGSPAFALIDSSSVIVVTDDGGARFSARNRIGGRVGSVRRGAVNSDVEIRLPGGGTVSATVTNRSCDELGLAEGVGASAIFKASSVIVGVPA